MGAEMKPEFCAEIITRYGADEAKPLWAPYSAKDRFEASQKAHILAQTQVYPLLFPGCALEIK